MKPTFTKHQLADQMRNYIHIEDKYLEGLTTYRMEHMSGRIFKRELHEGTISHNGILHNIIYHGCTPYNVKRAVEIRCSFRAASSEYQIEPIVLVQIVIPYQSPE